MVYAGIVLVDQHIHAVLKLNGAGDDGSPEWSCRAESQ